MGCMADARTWRYQRRQSPPSKRSIAIREQMSKYQSSTWVPPSPGSLLYQTPSRGPTNGSWSWPWSPWAATAAAKPRTVEESFILEAIEALSRIVEAEKLSKEPVTRGLRVYSCGQVQSFSIGHHLDEVLLGKQLLGKQLGATLVYYVVCRRDVRSSPISS